MQPYHWRTTKRLVKSPKLYFYDTGLAAWLIGIQSPQQMLTHPLRGGLFENMVMMDALKFRWHRGLRDNLFFYRDSEGAEIDLLLEFGRGVFPIEIKAGATINTDYFKGLKHFAKLVSAAPNGGGLVYGGGERWMHNGTQIVPFDDVDALLPRAVQAPDRLGIDPGGSLAERITKKAIMRFMYCLITLERKQGQN